MGEETCLSKGCSNDIRYIRESVDLLRKRVEDVAKNSHDAREIAHVASAIGKIQTVELAEHRKGMETLLAQSATLLANYEPMKIKVEKLEAKQTRHAWVTGCASAFALTIGSSATYIIMIKDKSAEIMKAIIKVWG